MLTARAKRDDASPSMVIRPNATDKDQVYCSDSSILCSMNNLKSRLQSDGECVEVERQSLITKSPPTTTTLTCDEFLKALDIPCVSDPTFSRVTLTQPITNQCRLSNGGTTANNIIDEDEDGNSRLSVLSSIHSSNQCEDSIGVVEDIKLLCSPSPKRRKRHASCYVLKDPNHATISDDVNNNERLCVQRRSYVRRAVATPRNVTDRKVPLTDKNLPAPTNEGTDANEQGQIVNMDTLPNETIPLRRSRRSTVHKLSLNSCQRPSLYHAPNSEINPFIPGVQSEVVNDDSFSKSENRQVGCRSRRRHHRIPLTDGAFLCLYRWPVDTNSHVYLLQDQLIDFLCFRSFKRKYNTGLQRRRIEPKERNYLRKNRKLRTDQVYSNSIVLLVDEVLCLLKRDFPNHHEVLETRLQQAISNGELDVNYRLGPSFDLNTSKCSRQKRKETLAARNRRLQEEEDTICVTSSLQWLMRSDDGFIFPDVVKDQRLTEEPITEVAAASAYNALLLARRRRVPKCFNLQTMQPCQAGRRRSFSATRPSVIGAYPVRLLNGQQVDGCAKRFSKDELFRMPFKTIIAADRNSAGRSESTSINLTKTASEVQRITNTLINQQEQRVLINSGRVYCPICFMEVKLMKSSNTSVIGSALATRQIRCLETELLSTKCEDPYMECTQCHSYSHLRCIEMSLDMFKVARSYDWQCINCRTCAVCRQMNDENMIMFCDRCDRGYHSYCVGLLHVPQGSWICKPCEAVVDATGQRALFCRSQKLTDANQSNLRDTKTNCKSSQNRSRRRNRTSATVAAEQVAIKTEPVDQVESLNCSVDNESPSVTAQRKVTRRRCRGRKFRFNMNNRNHRRIAR